MDALDEDDFVGFNLNNNMAEVYAFVGMHHIFERGTGKVEGTSFLFANMIVNRIKFGNNDNDILAFASSDGIITIASAMQKPQVIIELVGHSQPIIDFDWSLSNEYLISTSLDNTIRVWNVNSGKCVRTILCKTPASCIQFHPLNNNIFLVRHGHIY
jgi:WD40 repeat protein